jgi:aminoglycoside phosphotransferase (APT) family kinase protein
VEDVELGRAVAATRSVVTSLGLAADEALVLSNSNKVILRLLPSDLVARVAPAGQMSGWFELELAGRLVTAGSPVVPPDPRSTPRVHRQGGFVLTLWASVAASDADVSPQDYALALRDLHAGLRGVDLVVPHATHRVASAQQLMADPDQTPDLGEADRALITTTLTRLRSVLDDHRRADQLLHGEPHPGNLLVAPSGPLFIDFETCCRGPVEFDIAHAPPEVAACYSGIDHELLRQCQILVLAMITAWRWDRDDQFPRGRELATLWTDQLRAAVSGSDDLVPRSL